MKRLVCGFTCAKGSTKLLSYAISGRKRRNATVRFDAEKDFGKIRAKVLYTLASTDVLYPPEIAPAVMQRLSAARVDATYFLLESPYGHDATTRTPRSLRRP